MCFLIFHAVERKRRELSANDIKYRAKHIGRSKVKQSRTEWEQGIEEEKEQRGVLLNSL
jgi:hypothetical protein